MSKYNELVKKLKEIFQIDRPELDFGIYRILNAKADDINDYLENTLKKKISDALATAGNANKEELEKQLGTAIKAAEDAGFNPEDSPKVKDLRLQIVATSQGANEHENAVFTHLLSFFSRYYDSGDFVSKRRYKGDTYAIPYAGEEVMLHWANKDQYYIKSGENFANYSFKLDDGRKVSFKLLAADTAKDNCKDNDADRRFVLIEPHIRTKLDDEGSEYEEEYQPVIVIKSGDADELVIQFEYKAVKKGTKQETLVAGALKSVLANEQVQSNWVGITNREPTEKNPNRTLLEKHLTTYTQRNTADYFIHKNLGGFLSNELDFYIKNEVMNLDNVQNAEVFSDIEKQLRMIQCLRSISTDIIRFLSQLENFQKKLWTKKKFVVSSEYCLSLDLLDESLYEEIITCQPQVDEWYKLGFIEQKQIDVTFLKVNKHLIVDTKNLQRSLKEKVLLCIEVADNKKIPTCIKSDNYQALRLLEHSYQKKIGQIYIDPPYNTGGDGFIYKDSFKSSSWMSFMNDRLAQAKELLESKGAIFVSINENERHNLEGVLNERFGKNNRIEEIIWARDTVSNNSTAYSTNHEYIEVFAKNKNEILTDKSKFRVQRDGYKEVTKLLEELNETYPSIDTIQEAVKNLYTDHKQKHIAFAVDQGSTKEEAKKTDPWKGLYPYKFVEYRSKSGKYVPYDKAKELDCSIWLFREVEPSMPAGKQATSTKDPQSENYRFYEVVDPHSGLKGIPPRAGWAFPQFPVEKRPSFAKHMENDKIKFKGEGKIPQIKYFLHQVESVISTSVIRQYADGEPKLEAMFGEKGLIENPKPPALIHKILDQVANNNSIILDFFGGSGTTAAATIDFNYERKKEISYLLIEQGSHFESVLVPRIKKSYFSTEWKNGKAKEPKSDVRNILFKHVALESYEDTLNNLELNKTGHQLTLLAAQPEIKEDYLLNYMLETESKGSILSTDDFKKPFDYKMKISVDSAGASEEKNIDLIETFNYLVGLHVNTIESNLDRGYVRIEGKLPSGERALVLWRDCEKIQYDDFTKFASRFDLLAKQKTFDVIYVNGDHNLPTAFTNDEGEVTRTLKLRQIEPEFLEQMFAPDELA